MVIDPGAFYSTYELGKVLGIGPKAIAIKCVRGEIEATNLNRRWIIPGHAAIAYLTASAKQTKQAREVAK